MQKVLNECTTKLIKFYLYNENLTLSWVDKLTCKNLQELSLSRMKLSNKKMQCILDNCPELREVRLEAVNDEPNDWSLSWKNQPKLEELHFILGTGYETKYGSGIISATSLEDLLKNCPKLHHVALNNSLSGINAITWPKHQSLEHLVLGNAGLSLKVLLAMIDAFPKLQHLHIPLLGKYKSQNEIQELRIRAAKQLMYLKKLFKKLVVNFVDSLEAHELRSGIYFVQTLPITLPSQKATMMYEVRIAGEEVDSESGSEDEGNEEI